MSPTPSPPTKTSHLPAARHETLQYRSTRERPHDLYDHNGLLSVHAATRYSKLFPVVEATARTLGRSSLDVVTEITKSTATCDWDPTHTEYIVVGPLEIMRTLPAWFPLEEDQPHPAHPHRGERSADSATAHLDRRAERRHRRLRAEQISLRALISPQRAARKSARG
jgi:hypothetical protein